MTAGLSLIAFMAVLGSGEVFYRAATESQSAPISALPLLMLSGVLTTPAVSDVLHQPRDRGAALSNAAAALCELGGFAHSGWTSSTWSRWLCRVGTAGR